MSGLSHITRVHVSRKLIDTAMDHLRRVGKQGCEGFAVWTGIVNGDEFHVTDTIIPKQRAMRSRNGVCVIIEPQALHDLNLWLYNNKKILLAQIHSHPSDAYHSGTDDDFPVATTVGSLSLVVPDFAVRPFLIDTTAVYRLSPHATWDELGIEEAQKLFHIA